MNGVGICRSSGLEDAEIAGTECVKPVNTSRNVINQQLGMALLYSLPFLRCQKVWIPPHGELRFLGFAIPETCEILKAITQKVIILAYKQKQH